MRLLLLTILFSMCFSVMAQQIPFQGKLTQDDEPFTGTVDMEFSIDRAGWTEVHEGAEVIDGFYSVVLGSETPLPGNLYERTDSVHLSIAVDGTALNQVPLYKPFQDAVPFFQGIALGGQGGTHGNLGSSFFVLNGQDSIPNVLTGVNWQNGGDETNNRGGLWLVTSEREVNETGTNDRRVDLLVADDGFGDAVGKLHLKGPHPFPDREGEAQWYVEAGAYTADGTSHQGMLHLRGTDTGNPLATLQVEKNSNGEEEGILMLSSNDGREFRVTPDGLEGDSGTASDTLLQVFNGSGAIRAELGMVNDFDASDLYMYGSNDSLNVFIEGAAGGYAGTVGVADSLGQPGAIMRSFRNGTGRVEAHNDGNFFARDKHNNLAGWFGTQGGNGGFWQIVGRDPDNQPLGAILAGHWAGLPQLVIEGSNQDPFTTLIHLNSYPEGDNEKGEVLVNSKNRMLNGQDRGARLGLNHQDFGMLELMGDNALNSATHASLSVDSVGEFGSAGNLHLAGVHTWDDGNSRDFFNVELRNDPNGNDPSGSAGHIELWGDSSPNFNVGFNGFEDHDLPRLELYGPHDDGGGWYSSNINLGVHNTASYVSGELILSNTQTGGNRIETVRLGSNNFNGAGAYFSLLANDGNERFSVDVDSLGALGAKGRLNLVGPFLNENGDPMEYFSVDLFNDNGGNDAFGGAGELSLWGDSSPNFILGSNSFDDHDLPRFSMYGRTDDGGSWFHSVFEIEVREDTTSNSTAMNLYNTDDGGVKRVGMEIRSNYGNGEGVILVKDANQNENIRIIGDGTIDAVTVNQSSDRRKKKDIQTLQGSLDKVKSLRGVSFAWKDETQPQDNIGLIAQEVEKVYPEVVHNAKDGYKSVNYAVLVGALVEAIKELEAEVAGLKAENAQLKAGLAEMKELKTEVAAIKTLLTESADQGKKLTSSQK